MTKIGAKEQNIFRLNIDGGVWCGGGEGGEEEEEMRVVM